MQWRVACLTYDAAHAKPYADADSHPVTGTNILGVGTGTPQWYLPATGEWLLAMSKLTGVDLSAKPYHQSETPTSTSEPFAYYFKAPKAQNLRALFLQAGGTVMDRDDIVWTASEPQNQHQKGCSVEIHYRNSDGNGDDAPAKGFPTFYVRSHQDQNSVYNCSVRPFILFDRNE